MSRKDDIIYHTAPSGLRMVYIHTPGARAGYCGLAVKVGSRDEDSHHHGLAHFVEHTLFKGTSKRSPWHIINRMEAVGGELNAYTTKEETVVYSAFPAGNLARGAELIADLAGNSIFPAAELAKEREVVADEINSYLDVPAEAVFDDFEDLAFAGSGLGHNILGRASLLKDFTSEVCRNYLRRWYVPGNMVAFACGPEPAARAIAILEKYLGNLEGDAPTHEGRQLPPPAVAPFDIHRPIDTHQAHTVAGARVPGMFSESRFAIALLTNILGGPGMNSLLNVALREKRGLVYSVEASTSSLTDCGLFTIYWGCDPADNDLCRRLATETVAKVADGSTLTPRRLAAAKKQFLGQQVVAALSTESRILGVARATLFRGHAASPEAITEAVNAVTDRQLSDLAASILQNCSYLTFMP